MKENNNIAIKVDNVSMHFNMASEQVAGIKEYLIKMLEHKLFFKDFVAVDGVSFEVQKGEVFGIVGTNGSGKSTLLKMVSGILEPSTGCIQTYGKIAPLIELGAGFDGDLTARENIFLNGAILGYEKSFLEEKFTEIVDFAELWDFLEMPIKNYSSGMVARIAFAIATIVKPDILIVDEILAVGDFLFQQKCEKRIQKLMADGTTVLIVSHSIDQIEKLCDRVLWIEKSKPKMIGRTFDVCNAYRNLQNSEEHIDLHEYQVVAKEKCHVCGNLVEFRDEPGMTYKSEAFCSICGAELRTSDLIDYFLSSKFGIYEGCLNDVEQFLNKSNILVCASKGSLYARLREYDGFHGLQGPAREWCSQIEDIAPNYISYNSMDVVIFEELLVCAENIDKVLLTIKDILKPGGCLLINVPIYENQKTINRDTLKHKIYRNGVLIHTQWGNDTADYLSKYGFDVKMTCTHKWYEGSEQPNLDKDKNYQQFMDSHPYYFYKFNCWPILCTKK